MRPPVIKNLSDAPLSPWVLLLDGLSKTAVGMGLMLGQAAAVVERRSAISTQRSDRAAITSLRTPAELDKAS